MNKTLLVLALSWLVTLSVSKAFAQGQLVSGKVISTEDGAELPGVNVLVKGTTSGTTTNVDGNYSLEAPENATLVFSYIGFVTQEIPVNNRTTINIQLAPDVKQLSEVVVTGYTTQERKDISGSIATVSSSTYKDIPVVGLDQALQGQAPGVQVTQSSGTPGGGISVRIRGNMSISAGNRPLFIVDGVPVETGALSQRDFGGQEDNALAGINPNDIESMTILKDASAKAIFGSRGSNGVVVITTKRGKEGKTAINLEVQRGVIDPTRKLDLLNSTELLELQREAVTNAGRNPDAEGLIPGVTNAVNTDWLDQIFRQGIMQQYQLSATGGTEKTRFYLSGAFRDEEGVQLNNRFTRYNATVNLDHTASSKLAFGSNLILSRTKNNRVKGDNFLDGVYSGAVKSLPYYHPYDEQGNLLRPGSPAYPGFPNFNPVAQALLPRFEAFTTKIVGGIYVEYSFLPNLKFRSKLNVDYSEVNEDQYESSATAIGGYLQSVGGKGYGVNSSTNYSSIVSSNILTYAKTIDDHEINVLGGVEAIKTTTRFSSVTGRLFPSDDFTYITSAGIVDNGSSGLVNSGLFSLFGKVDYNIADKYLFALTSRYDGSSRFGPKRKFGFFPALSLAWRLSNEPFMKGNDFINDLKLRASIGYSGNERVGDFLFLAKWASVPYNGVSGVTAENPKNENLRWEGTRETNVGVDFTAWNGRINATVDVYYNLTTGLLYNKPMAATTGFTSLTANIGKLSNKGVELGLTTINLDGNLKWTTSFNLTKNINTIVSLVNDTSSRAAGYTGSGISRTNIIKPGQPIGAFWGLQFMGVDPATGDAIYADTNSDGVINENDAIVIGSPQPDLTGGITNRLSYKGFDLSAFFQFSYGNEILNFSNTSLLNAGEDLAYNQVREALKRWRKPGDITSVPRYEAGNTVNNWHSSRFIEDGSYVRLKNLTVGYTLPNNLLSRFKVSSIRVFASGTNLWTLTPYTGDDPEVSTLDGSSTAQGIDFFTLPQVRTMMIGVNLGF